MIFLHSAECENVIVNKDKMKLDNLTKEKEMV